MQILLYIKALVLDIQIWLNLRSKCCAAPIEKSPPGYCKEYCSKCGGITRQWSRDI